jgi:adenylate kinase
LCAHYQIPTISTGDIFRAMQHSTTPLAEQVRAIMAVGGYVTDDVTNAIVAERLSQPDCQAGFLLDGYARTLAQVTNLDSAGRRRPRHRCCDLSASPTKRPSSTGY